MKVAPCVEHSCCCINFGKMGFACAERKRKHVMMTGCLCNFLATIFLIVGSIGGLSTKASVLTRLSWVKGEGEVVLPNIPPVQITAYIGLKAQYQELSCLNQVQMTSIQNITSMGWTGDQNGCFKKTVRWDDEITCQSESQELTNTCNECKKNLLPVSTLFFSIFGQLPTMATNLQRTTRFGDVNCQSTMGVFSNLISLFSSMATLLAFRMSCKDALPTTILGNVTLTWSMGLGYQLVILGTVVKVLDMVCHCLVPTPKERWQKPGEEVSDALAYLSLAAPEEKESPPTD